MCARCIWRRFWRAAETMSGKFEQKIHTTLENANLQLAIYANTGRLKDNRTASVAESALPDYQELRTHAHALKNHTIDNLDYYLEEFERSVTAHGGKVVSLQRWRGGLRFHPGSGQGARREADREVEVDDHRGNRPQRAAGASRSRICRDGPGRVHHPARTGRGRIHIVAPALHMTRYDVAELFEERLRFRTTRSSRTRR